MADLTFGVTVGSNLYATGEKHTIVLPKYYKADGTRRAVIAAHGLLGDATSWATGMLELRTFAALGFPCIHADLGGFATWGNDTVQARITDAWNYMKFVWGVADDQFVGYAQSMGGPALLNYLRAHPTDMAALAGEVPVIGLDETHDRNPLALAGSIEAAYGGLSGYNAAIATHDPFQNLAAHALIAEIVPTKFWTAPDDDICNPTVALQFAAATGVEFTSMGPGGHRPLDAQFFTAVGDFIRPYVFRQTATQGLPAIRHTFGTSDLVAA